MISKKRKRRKVQEPSPAVPPKPSIDQQILEAVERLIQLLTPLVQTAQQALMEGGQTRWSAPTQPSPRPGAHNTLSKPWIPASRPGASSTAGRTLGESRRVEKSRSLEVEKGEWIWIPASAGMTHKSVGRPPIAGAGTSSAGRTPIGSRTAVHQTLFKQQKERRQVFSCVGPAFSAMNEKQRLWLEEYLKIGFPQRERHIRTRILEKDGVITDRRKRVATPYALLLKLNLLLFSHGLSIPRVDAPHLGWSPPPSPILTHIECQNGHSRIEWNDPPISLSNTLQPETQAVVQLQIKIDHYIHRQIIGNWTWPSPGFVELTSVEISPGRLRDLEQRTHQKVSLTPEGKVPLACFQGRVLYAQMDCLLAPDPQTLPIVSPTSNVMKVIIR